MNHIHYLQYYCFALFSYLVEIETINYIYTVQFLLFVSSIVVSFRTSGGLLG